MGDATCVFVSQKEAKKNPAEVSGSLKRLTWNDFVNCIPLPDPVK